MKETEENIIKTKIQVGITPCGSHCNYFSGSNQKHSCGKPIYKAGFKCKICGESYLTEPACKAHITIKHKKELNAKTKTK